MSITIAPVASISQMKVTGDIDAHLQIPAEPPQMCADGWKMVECYFIALSDGTLVRATNHISPEYDVIREGAGLVTVDGAKLIVDWAIEWITLSPVENAVSWKREVMAELPLFPEPIAA